jgi:type III pantothenate kinase
MRRNGLSEPTLLVLDVGNTHTVLGLFQGHELIEHWRIATDPSKTTDETGILLLGLLRARGLDASIVTDAVVCCVVPPAVHTISRACRRYFNVEPRFVGSDLDAGMPIACDNPHEVGADRIVNAVAAFKRFGSACVVVDFGTATTFDVVRVDGVYDGGVIAPGLGISLEALFQHASKLPRVSIKRPPQVVGKTTVSSMQSGIVYGYVGLVDGILERILDELDGSQAGKVNTIATGGFAGLIAHDSRYLSEVDSFLTLRGLHLIHQLNE